MIRYLRTQAVWTTAAVCVAVLGQMRPEVEGAAGTVLMSMSIIAVAGDRWS